jgi:hypothetical protein
VESLRKSWLQDDFIEIYTSLKKQHLLDKEIAARMYITKNTLYLLKKAYGVPLIKGCTRELHNPYGLTRDLLEQAKEIGLESHIINQRVREYGWSLEKALKVPPLKSGRPPSRQISTNGI